MTVASSGRNPKLRNKNKKQKCLVRVKDLIRERRALRVVVIAESAYSTYSFTKSSKSSYNLQLTVASAAQKSTEEARRAQCSEHSKR
eukprot:scaffold4836_cov127-Isochrysis_galbana.AAC.3